MLLFLGTGLSMAGDKVVTNHRNALIFAYSPVNSVFEDENIKLEIYNEQLYATNKTKKTIFIDLSQSFLLNNGTTYPMFTKTLDEKKASKPKVTTSIDEYLSIPPMMNDTPDPNFVCSMAGYVLGTYSTTESPTGNFSNYEKRLRSVVEELLIETNYVNEKGKETNPTTSASRHLLEDESISNIGATIAYAFSKKAEEWNQIAVSTWVSDVIFAPIYAEIPVEIKNKDKKGFGIKETKPVVLHIKAESPFEFNKDKSPLIVTDFTSSYNEGKFYLNTTRVTKESKTNPFLAGLATLFTGGLGAALFVPVEEYAYKSILNFDGPDSDWGEMKYAKSINKAVRK